MGLGFWGLGFGALLGIFGFRIQDVRARRIGLKGFRA